MRAYWILLSATWASLIMCTGCVHFPVTSRAEQVVLLHGYGRDESAMRPMRARLVAEGYQVISISYRSLTREISEIQSEVNQKIDLALAEHPLRTHFVGHSLGGLLIRAYLADHLTAQRASRLGSVVTLGSPSRGTPVANQLTRSPLIRMMHPAAQALGVGGSPFLASLPKPNYPLGVIAGRSPNVLIKGTELSGAHDGLVSLASTRVDGMRDLCEVQVNHTQLRVDPEVFRQVLHFLRSERFECDSVTSSIPLAFGLTYP